MVRIYEVKQILNTEENKSRKEKDAKTSLLQRNVENEPLCVQLLTFAHWNFGVGKTGI